MKTITLIFVLALIANLVYCSNGKSDAHSVRWIGKIISKCPVDEEKPEGMRRGKKILDACFDDKVEVGLRSDGVIVWRSTE